MSIIFSTCWYPFKAKFDVSVYREWMSNLLDNVHGYYLVIYTDESNEKFFSKWTNVNSNIKVVVLPVEQFFYYQYKDQWIKNHEINHELNTRVDWRVNMLWAEKTQFVKKTMESGYFDLAKEMNWYGWCDIGYFRFQLYPPYDLSHSKKWPNPEKIEQLNPNKIHYACVNNDSLSMREIVTKIQNKNEWGLPQVPLPPNQISIAGGFFLIHRNNVLWWANTFHDKLQLYFKHDYLVKDDQMIIVDCVFTDIRKFVLHKEDHPLHDNWFMFQRILL